MDTAPSSTGIVPPPPPPPPVITATPPAPRRSRGWMIFAIILVVLLAVSWFGFFAVFVSQALSLKGGLGSGISSQVGPSLDECLIKDNDASSKIAVVTVDGIITGQSVDQAGNNMVDLIKAQLDRAKDDRRVKAVILKVDSPGGEVLASDEIYRAINDFQKDSSKPVVCSMGSLAASGGYYISSPCRWIVANDLTITGSIGVILHTWNYRGLMDKIGIWPDTFKSGKFKDMLSGERETNEIPAEERVMVQGLIDETYQKFKDVVAAGRDAAHARNKKEGRPLALDWTNYADGRVLSGTKAYDLGFVDEIGDFQDAVDRAKQIAGIREANLIEYRERYDISNILRLLGQSEMSHSVKLDLGVELPKLQAGELYFLSPTFIN
ncbi:MAG TPA: signal peptide peptidase SppA [Candidatus Acidoferrales bacterium]|nr:signal peptide peptidase SppA [Candidatus Acidoferrales bacterium]